MIDIRQNFLEEGYVHFEAYSSMGEHKHRNIFGYIRSEWHSNCDPTAEFPKPVMHLRHTAIAINFA
jgi:hypothetical protein